MSLSALLMATNEIGNVNDQFSLISHNIANASTPDFAQEEVTQTSLTADGVGLGAMEGVVTQSINTQMQGSVFAQNAQVSGLTTQQTALQQIDAAEGTVAGGTDIGSLLGNLQDAFSTLEGEPDSSTQQQAVVSAAQALATQINTVSDTVQTQLQTAQNNVVSGVAQVNTTLGTLGSLSDQIMQAQAAGQSTADLENQRDAAEDSLSQMLGVNFIDQPNGDLLVVTQSGLNLPIHTANPLSTSSATVSASTTAQGGGIPPITLNGQDVTSSLTGGQLGANITLRDATLPTIQANLDEFSETLATRFSAQGLTLFTDASGSVPGGGGSPAQSSYLGFSSEIQVNPEVLDDPSLVRDGTDAIAGSATGASAFTPNPAGGPTGFTTLIARVLTYALGSEAQAGVPQTAPSTSGLGASGTLNAGFAAPGDLADFAAAITGAEASRSSTVTSQLDTAQALQTSLQSQLAAGSSVNMDAQMSQMIVLQNAYDANARMISTVQAAWSQLLQSVQT